MFDSFKQHWWDFRGPRPGRRFVESYRRNHRNGKIPGKRVFKLLSATGLVLLGLVMLPAPGPGMIVLLVGLALFASEFLWLARLLDLVEVRIRGVLRYFSAFWAKASTVSRGVLIGLIVLGLGTLGYLIYWLLR